MITTITANQKERIIEGYNALVKDYLKLNIGDMPLIEASYMDDVEALFIFQGIVASELIKEVKELKQVEINISALKNERVSKKFKQRKKSDSTSKVKAVLQKVL